MDAMEAILTRRSIRKYTNKTVPEAVVKELLEAAMSAPSAGNQQPWQFIVINDRKTLDEIPKFHPFSQPLREASVAIVICGDLQRENFKGFWVQDCSAATENILVAARARGLGTVWLGVYPMDDRIKGMRKLLGLPETIVPLSIIPVGYPAEERTRANRYDTSRVHYNRWS